MEYELGGHVITAILCAGFGCLAATIIVMFATYQRGRIREAQDRQLLLRAVRSFSTDETGHQEFQGAGRA